MAARLPVSATSIAYRIKPAWQSKILVMYWPAGANSAHRLRSGDTTTTILTRATSGATYNATEGRTEGVSTTQFTDSIAGGYGGLREQDPMTMGASYWGDGFDNISQFNVFSCRSTYDEYDGNGLVFTGAAGVRLNNQGPTNPGGFFTDDVQAALGFAGRFDPNNATANARLKLWAAGVNNYSGSATAGARTDLMGDTARPFYFGHSNTGINRSAQWWEATWFGTVAMTDADMAAITLDPSVAVEVVVVDTTVPTLTGSITPSLLTHNSYTLTWPAGADNVGVAGYDLSLNGGSSWADVGNVLTYAVSGRTPSATDAVRVRARDAAGNVSTPALAVSVTLNAAPADSTAPAMTGSITPSALTSTGYTLTWPAATDAVGVTGYERSLDGGSTYSDIGLVLTTNVSGRTPGATDQVRIRAYDAAANKATPLSLAVTLASGSTGSLTTPVILNASGAALASTAVVWSWLPTGRVGSRSGKTPQDGTGTTNSSGVLTATGLPTGAGELMVAVQGTTISNDRVFYFPGTAA